MTTYTGNIVDAKLLPMIILKSTIRISVNIPDLNKAVTLYEHGSMKDLCDRFGLAKRGERNWDLSHVIDRPCKIISESGVFKFLNYN